MEREHSLKIADLAVKMRSHGFFLTLERETQSVLIPSVSTRAIRHVLQIPSHMLPK